MAVRCLIDVIAGFGVGRVSIISTKPDASVGSVADRSFSQFIILTGNA